MQISVIGSFLYIQLHEFESLLFSDISVIENNFEYSELDRSQLHKINKLFANPEDINDGKDTAPSKRLDGIIADYNKIVYGSLLAQEIGLEKIRKKCPRFNAWIKELLAIK
ncbi:MAG: DUF4276 family protein [Bacteroidales bacterium]